MRLPAANKATKHFFSQLPGLIDNNPDAGTLAIELYAH